MPSHVWTFTNQRKLTRKEFIDYFEKKVFRTIRKFEMLPSDKVFKMAKGGDLNTVVLMAVLGKKFKVEFGGKINTSSENLSGIAEEVFGNILKGKFTGKKPKDKLIYPLYYHSDAEIELYALLAKLKGRKVSRKGEIQELFNKFMKKNPDLEINVVKALGQIS